LPRGKNIGGLTEETKKQFNVLKLQEDFKNNEAFLKFLLEAYAESKQDS
jgi:hypothetical protein